MLGGFSLGNYLLLVDYAGRLFRQGKAVISREVAAIFDRLGSSAETSLAERTTGDIGFCGQFENCGCCSREIG